ncbi:hypothetical protein, partial [Legionella waltersii]
SATVILRQRCNLHTYFDTSSATDNLRQFVPQNILAVVNNSLIKNGYNCAMVWQYELFMLHSMEVIEMLAVLELKAHQNMRQCSVAEIVHAIEFPSHKIPAH